MQYIEFKTRFLDYPVFSKRDIEKEFPNFNKMNLVNWQNKGYIFKLRREFYCFTDRVIHEFVNNYIANRLYKPSYISLETALFHYGFIPEGVFTITSISTLKTQLFENPLGRFSYQSIAEQRFFGYKLVQQGNITFKIADPEKAILDFFYLNHNKSTKDDLDTLRLNKQSLKKGIDFEKLDEYAQLIDSKVLIKTASLIKKYTYA